MQVEARSIVVEYGQQRIIDHVSLTIRAGEFVGLIGPNGAGKSTLVRALAGLQPLSSGRVLWDGQDETGMALRERARRVAYLAQKQNADWPLRAYDVVMLGRLPHRASFGGETDTDRQAVERAFASVELHGFHDRILDHLSGGERARLLLAKALAAPSNLLILDEPTNDLDLETLDLLEEMLCDYAGTVILVSHDRDFLDRVATSIVLAEGDGTFREYAGGYADITTRANLQLREIAPTHTIDVLSGLVDIGLTSRGSGADNIRNIAAELNIGIDSLVFIDDNPFERNLVRQELPMVAVPEVSGIHAGDFVPDDSHQIA